MAEERLTPTLLKTISYESAREKWQIKDINTESSTSGTVIVSSYNEELLKTSIFVYSSVKGKLGADRLKITPHRQETCRYLVALIESNSQVLVVFKNQIESYDLNTDTLQQSIKLDIQPTNLCVRGNDIFIASSSSNRIAILGLDFRRKRDLILKDVDTKDSISDLDVDSDKLYVCLTTPGLALSFDITRGKKVLSFENSLSVVSVANSITVYTKHNLVFVLWDKSQVHIYSNVDGCCFHAVTFLQSWKIRMASDYTLVTADNTRDAVQLYDMDRIIKLVTFQKVLFTSLKPRERKSFVRSEFPVERSSQSDTSKLGDMAMSQRERLRTLSEMHENVLIEYNSFLAVFRSKLLENQKLEEESNKNKSQLKDLKKEIKSQKKTIKFFQNQLQITKRVTAASETKEKRKTQPESFIPSQVRRKSSESRHEVESGIHSTSDVSTDSGLPSSVTSARGLKQRHEYEIDTSKKHLKYLPENIQGQAQSPYMVSEEPEDVSDSHSDSSSESEVSEYFSTTGEIPANIPPKSPGSNKDDVVEQDPIERQLANLSVSHLGMTELQRHYSHHPTTDRPTYGYEFPYYLSDQTFQQGGARVVKSPLSTMSLVSEDGEKLQIHGTNVELEIPPNALKEPTIVEMNVLSDVRLETNRNSFATNSTSVVELLPNNLQFKRPVQLSLPHCMRLTRDYDQRLVKIFISHHNEGYMPNWEEIPDVAFQLKDDHCVIFLRRFCWVTYQINDDIVEGKRIRVFTAGKQLRPNDKIANLEVGYYPDLPGFSQRVNLPKEIRLEQHKPFLFMRRGENDLRIHLNRLVSKNWKYITPNENPKKIAFRAVSNSEVQSCHFVLERLSNYFDIPTCVFLVGQSDKLVQLTVRPQVKEN